MERPDFSALEEHLVRELGPALAAALAGITADDPLACCVIDAAPYYGCYALHLDVRSNQLALLRGEQAQRLARRAWTRATKPDAWMESAAFAAIDGLARFSSEVADYAMPFVHEVKVDLHAFTHSPEYEALGAEAGADGLVWLDGHAIPMLFRVWDRVVDGGAFAGVPCTVPAIVGFTLGEARATVCRLLLGG
ncbi:MAG: hypothetical protein AB1730_06755 [Myxococcota bacterium]